MTILLLIYYRHLFSMSQIKPLVVIQLALIDQLKTKFGNSCPNNMLYIDKQWQHHLLHATTHSNGFLNISLSEAKKKKKNRKTFHRRCLKGPKYASAIQKIFKNVYESSVSKVFKGAVSDLRQFLATESPLKIMENAFYFFLKALFVLKIFKFLS